MKISILGDSVSTLQGYNPPGFLAFYSPYQIPLEDTWWKQVIDAWKGELLVNNSFCGSTIASASPTVETFPSAASDGRIALGTNPDVILIYMGINDLVNGIPLYGEQLNSFEGGCNRLLSRLHQKYPQAEIVCIAPPYPELQEILNKTVQKSGDRLAVLNGKIDTYDGFHPTRTGMHQMARQILEQIPSI